MTPELAINEVIQDYDKKDPTAPQQAARRVQLLGFLQQVHDFVYYYKDWTSFTYRESTITVQAANNNVELTLANLGFEFYNFGDHGSLFGPDHREYFKRPAHLIVRLKRLGGGNFVRNIFSIFQNRLQFPYTFTSNTTFDIFFREKAPVLQDTDPTEMSVPDKYYKNVILPALLFRSQGSKHDMREVWAGMFKDGLSMMCGAENPAKNELPRMPISIPGAW